MREDGDIFTYRVCFSGHHFLFCPEISLICWRFGSDQWNDGGGRKGQGRGEHSGPGHGPPLLLGGYLSTLYTTI